MKRKTHIAMRNLVKLGMGLAFLALGACGEAPKTNGQAENAPLEPEVKSTVENPVVETIMARRSIRKYQDKAIEADKLEEILKCGINAPNGMYKQSWEVRVVQDPEFMAEINEGFAAFRMKNGAKKTAHVSFGAPCLVFIAYDKTYDLSQVDCGLLGGNIILSAQSMGLGSCCLGGLIRYINSPEAAGILKRLDLPESHQLLYAIALGYPDEAPAAKPRDMGKVKFISSADPKGE